MLWVQQTSTDILEEHTTSIFKVEDSKARSMFQAWFNLQDGGKILHPRRQHFQVSVSSHSMTSMESRYPETCINSNIMSFMECPLYRTNEVPILWYFVWIILYYDIHIDDKECKASIYLSFCFLLDLMTPYHLCSFILFSNNAVMNNELKRPG
jgi:hypothetical protein